MCHLLPVVRLAIESVMFYESKMEETSDVTNLKRKSFAPGLVYKFISSFHEIFQLFSHHGTVQIRKKILLQFKNEII